MGMFGCQALHFCSHSCAVPAVFSWLQSGMHIVHCQNSGTSKFRNYRPSILHKRFSKIIQGGPMIQLKDSGTSKFRNYCQEISGGQKFNYSRHVTTAQFFLLE
jgi:hypothetical protein